MYPMAYRWMSVPTPVTKSTIVIDSASTSSAASTCNEPAVIHVNSFCTGWRPSPDRGKNPAKGVRARMIAVVASQAASGSPMRLPKKTSVRNPASGNSGMKTAASITSALENVEVVGGGTGGAAAEDGHDHAEADHDLGRGHHHHEEH